MIGLHLGLGASLQGGGDDSPLISLVGFTSAQTSNPPLPDGVVTNDLIIRWAVRITDVPSPPEGEGWNIPSGFPLNIASGVLILALAWKRAESDTPADSTWTNSGGRRRCIVFRNAQVGTIPTPYIRTTTSNVIQLPAISPIAPGSWGSTIFAEVAGGDRDMSQTVPEGYTEYGHTDSSPGAGGSYSNGVIGSFPAFNTTFSEGNTNRAIGVSFLISPWSE